MSEDDIYDNLPSDPELAFLYLEAKFRDECEISVARLDDRDNPTIFYVNYIAQVLGAINALELENAFSSDVPAIENVDYNTYLNFSKDVKHYTTQLRIRNTRRTQGFSVKFDGAAKTKIHHFINQMRDFLLKLELSPERREPLIAKLNSFASEVDRDRTRLEAWGNFTIEVAGVMGDAAEKLEPIRKWVDSISRLIWGARAEEKPMLPAPQERKRIEPPKPQKSSRRDELDDEIPF